MGFEVDCIDVSFWQRVIDWDRVKRSGVKNAYIRATIGSTGVDINFERNRQEATIPVSFYHLFKGHLDGKSQADHFINTIQNWNLNLPPAIDVEDVADDTSNDEERTEQLNRMVQRILELTNQLPVIYTGLVWNGLITPRYDNLFSQCKLWIAQYNGSFRPSPLPRGWDNWWMWQYTSLGSVDGINGRVDLNRFNKSIPFRLGWPTEYSLIVQLFGVNTTGVPDFYTRFGLAAHEGLDFRAPHGSKIFACADGVISRIDRTDLGHAYGVQIRIKHTASDAEYETAYGHLLSVRSDLKVGDAVRRGEMIALADNTGNSRGDHLHLLLKKRGATARGEQQQLGDGRWVIYPSDIVNPTPYLDPFEL